MKVMRRSVGKWCARRLITAAAAAVLFSLVGPPPARATHFRYGHITWAPRADIGPRTAEFTVQNVWRRDAYTTSNSRCIDVSTLTAIPCTGPGGAAGVGDVIHERQGGTRFDPGDGSGLIGTNIPGSGSNSNALLYLVTSIDPVNNWLFGLALDPSSIPAIDTTITHTYGGDGPYTAKIENCCRISPCDTPNAHLNNPDNGYRVATVVTFGGDDSSPVSSLPPIIQCPENGVCSFTVPASDNEVDPLSFRLSTSTEAGFDVTNGTAPGPGLGQPGPPACPNAAAIDSSTGVYTWDTSGCRLAGSPLPEPPAGGCNNASLNSLYSTQVVVEEASKSTEVAVDFLVQLLPVCPQFNSVPPEFDTPPTPLCGTGLSVNPGQSLSFTVQATDADANDSVSLNAAGIPGGAVMTPQLPQSGDPVSSSLSWTPTAGDLGQHVITFTATDQCGLQALCSITIDVSQENCSDGIDNDGDGLADCADPDCNGTPCDDGLFCTANDTCQGGVCGSGPPRNCSDGNSCTADSCDENAGQCVHDAAALEGASCDDGEFCTTGDTCQSGACQAGSPRDCGDGNPCTADSCDENANACVYDAAPLEAAPCEGGDFCTVNQACQAGACAGGEPRDCSDGNSCTADSCDSGSSQCVHDPAPLQGASCDDGSACTTSDSCTNGTCGGAGVVCNDGDPCTVDSCDPISGCAAVEAPASGCANPVKSVLVIKNRADTKKDRLIWRWLKGPADFADFGDPAGGSTSYTLCVYDQSNAGNSTRLAMRTHVQPGGTCDGADCWKAYGKVPNRLKFKDRSDTGSLKVVLKATNKGTGKIIVKGKGDRIAPPAPVGPGLMSEDSGVVVQLFSSDGKCWESRYAGPPKKTTAEQFKDTCGTRGQSRCQ